MTENYSKQPSPDGIVFAPIPKDKRFKDITGLRFKEWVVRGYSRKVKQESGSSQKLWWCQCVCGTVKEVAGCNLIQGNSGSCGCVKNELSRKRATKHGMADGPIYKTWQHMHGRCGCKTDTSYPRYGARGIRVCPEWSGPGGFQRFYDHVRDKPTPSHSIGRIDNNGNYEPGNVRWEDDFQQANNKRCNVMITHKGKEMTTAECSRATGINSSTLRFRIKSGVPHDICTSMDKYDSKITHRILHNGKLVTVAEFARSIGVHPRIVYYRKRKGWSDSELATIQESQLRKHGPRKPSQTASTAQHA